MGNVAGSLTYDTKLDTNGFEKGVNGLSSSAVAIGNIMADVVKKVADTVADVVKTGINYNAQLEQYQVALTTLTGSADEAQKIMEQIKEDAAKTPFDVSGLTQANQLLISAGVSSDRARKDILNLGNAISATGGGNEELSRMAVNLQQIKNVGKASALDIKQFAYAGIDVYGLLADYMGVARDEATEMDITYEDLTGALAFASQEGGKYYGAMEEQSKTLNGQMSTLKDNFMNFAGEAAEPLFNFLKDSALPVLNDLLTGGEKAHQWLEDNEQPLTLLAILIGTITTAIIAYTIAQNAAAIATTIMTAASTAFGAVMAFVTSPITLVILAIGALIAIGYLLVKNWDAIKDAAIKVFGYVKNFVVGIINGIRNAFSSIADIGRNIVYGIWNGITGTANWLLNKIKGFAKTITNGIKSFFGIHSPSKLFRDEIGKNLILGVGVAFEKDDDLINKQINDFGDDVYKKMQGAVNMETGKMAFSGTTGSVSQILSSNATFDGNFVVKAEVQEGTLFEANQRITREKRLQTGFGG